MAIVPIDNAHLTQSLLNDAMQMRTFVQWIEARYSVYNQNCSTANMTAAGISSGDQTTVLAFIADLSRINTLAGGTVPSNAANIAYDVNAILGIL